MERAVFMLERFFKLKENGTNVNTEIIAGITTFFTMVYIVAVNPQMLSQTGMDRSAVFVATVIASVIGTLVMALFANVPYAQGPGMGMNAFFTYTVVFALNFSWQQALGLVFICGVFNILITMTSIRKSLITAIPESLQKAIGGGIGLFIAYMGMKNAGFIEFSADPGTFVVFESGAASLDGSIIPALVNFTSPGAVLALIGLLVTVVLMVLNIKGAIFIGIFLTTIIGIPMGITQIPDKLVSVSEIGNISQTFGAVFSSQGLPSLFSDPSKLMLVILTAFAFSLTDTFDTIGTFIGTGSASGLFTKKEMDEFAIAKKFSTRLDRALFSDSIATSIGAVLGTSNVTTYVESSAGISVGGRTGLTSLVISILFLLCLPFANVFNMVPSQATAPALILVGVLMMGSLMGINWDDLEEAIPAFFAVVMMPFAYSITQGVAFGFIMYCLVKISKSLGIAVGLIKNTDGKNPIKDIHPILGVSTLLFIINFVMTAVQNMQ